MLNNVFYHGTIRKTIIAFGKLFSDIYIDRKQGDSVDGNIVQRLQIPITYGPKEKWIVRIEQDPNLTNHTYISLPRMAFEITGYSYDSTRKIAKNNKIKCYKDGSSTDMMAPVPYNINVTLNVLTKNQEDGMQIIEQILPVFTPHYTMSINAVPDMNIIQDIPICLESVSVDDNYEGDFQTRRFVNHTLTFTIKLNLYGPVNNNKVILQANANIGQDEVTGTNTVYVANGDPVTGVVSGQWIDGL